MRNRFMSKYVSEIAKFNKSLEDLRSFSKSYKNKGTVWDNNDLLFKIKRMQRELNELTGMIERLDREEKTKKRKRDANI